MNFSKKNHKLVDQNERFEKKPQKHDANLQKNTTLYFQVGLILVLLITYGLFEMQFQVPNYDSSIQPPIEDDDLFVMKEYKVYDEQAPKKEVVKKKTKKVMITTTPTVIKNEGSDTPETEVFTPDQNTTSNNNLKPSDVNVIEDDEDHPPVSFIAVEQVPTFPGCEKYDSNVDKKKCMSDKISKLVNRKFNTDLAQDLGLSSGKKTIRVLFKIDKQGNVTDVQARAPHSRLEKEAERVIKKIPQMEPGKQKDKAVEVLYSLPIVFEVRN